MIKIGELVFRSRPGGEIGIGRQLLRRELGQLGYAEGKNVVFETRSAEGKVAGPVVAGLLRTLQSVSPVQFLLHARQRTPCRVRFVPSIRLLVVSQSLGSQREMFRDPIAWIRPLTQPLVLNPMQP